MDPIFNSGLLMIVSGYVSVFYRGSIVKQWLKINKRLPVHQMRIGLVTIGILLVTFGLFVIVARWESSNSGPQYFSPWLELVLSWLGIEYW